jgi:hypothetical protein
MVQRADSSSRSSSSSSSSSSSRSGRGASAGGGKDAIAYCFSVALSRQPSTDETTRFTDFLTAREASAGGDDAKRKAALADTCHLMLCVNEFLYVD